MDQIPSEKGHNWPKKGGEGSTLRQIASLGLGSAQSRFKTVEKGATRVNTFFGTFVTEMLAPSLGRYTE